MIVNDKIIQIDSTGTVNNFSFKYENGFDPKNLERFELNEKKVFSQLQETYPISQFLVVKLIYSKFKFLLITCIPHNSSLPSPYEG